MRIATLERFAEPSRRADPDRLGGTRNTVETWNLPGVLSNPFGLLRGIPGALLGWSRHGIPAGERRRVARACLGTGGARLGALVRAPELWERAGRGDVDGLACYSAKDFALAHLLSRRMGTAPREEIARGTRYFGEFAFELLAVVPYAYWLHRHGRLEFTVSTPDTRCLYYFSASHEERPVSRRYVPITEYPIGERGILRYDRKAFPTTLNTGRWMPPPYRAAFRNDRFRFGRDLCVVSNKASSERYLRRGFAVNSMDTGLVLDVIGRLRTRYQVVYSRPRASDIVTDHQAIRDPGDIEAVKRAYPDVLTVQGLHSRNRDLSFNELQLHLLASCERFVSVLGGGAYLASYFGGTNVVYARRGWEVTSNAFENWFDRFSGARVVSAGTGGELLRAVDRELVGVSSG